MEKAVTPAERSKALRYKRPALASMGYEALTSELYEIQEACSDVAYYFPQGDDTLLDALDGDEEDAFEFQMAFSELSAKVDRLVEVMYEIGDQQQYDDCTVALIGNRYTLVGFDGYEEDYFQLAGYESHLAESEAGKRMMRHTKAEMLSIIGQSVGTLIAFLDIRQQYDYLKATIDILRGENQSMLQAIKRIEELYDRAQMDDWEQVRRDRDAAVEDMTEMIGDIEEIRRGYGVDNADADSAFASLCGNYCANNGYCCYEESENYRCKHFKWRGMAKED